MRYMVKMMRFQSRRKLLKLSALSTINLLGGLHLRQALAQEPDDGFDPGGRVPVEYDETAVFMELLGHPPAIGRVEWQIVRVEEKPEHASGLVRHVRYADVVPIYGAVEQPDELYFPHNAFWFDVGDGYIHSSPIVPVREYFNAPEDVPVNGFWGEITVPTSWQHWEPKLRSLRYYDLAYGAVFKVIDRAQEDDGRTWYKLFDDAYPTHSWWVQASHVRRLTPEDFRPISTGVAPEDKRIEVIIEDQLLTCYEGDRPVFMTKIASGTSFQDASGEIHHFHTPYGEHYVQRKTPTRHMIGGETIDDSYDLPGVPWCTFFTRNGAAIHGCYWHNDYGAPRSHGCINTTPDAARWIYRWVLPRVDETNDYYFTPEAERALATKIIVKHTPEG